MYRPFSRELMVCRETSRMAAEALRVIPRSLRSFLQPVLQALPPFGKLTLHLCYSTAGPVCQVHFPCGESAAIGRHSMSKKPPGNESLAGVPQPQRSRRNRMKIRHFRGHAPWNQPALRSGVGAQSASSQKGVSRRKRVSRGTSPTSSAAAHSLSMVLTTADSRQRYTLVGV